MCVFELNQLFFWTVFCVRKKNTQQCLSAVKNCVARLTAPAWNFFTLGFLIWKVALGFISIYIYEVCLSCTKGSPQLLDLQELSFLWQLHIDPYEIVIK